MSSPKPQDASENEGVDRKSPGDEVSEEIQQNAQPTKILEKASSSAEGETDKGGIENKDREQEEEGETEKDANAVPTNAQVPQHDWTAVYSPQYNAYYFYNPKTQETTWTNPLEPQASTSSEVESSLTPSLASVVPALPNPNLAIEGIDPELAYLDPSLAAGGPSNAAGLYAAKFNARTGRFTAMDGRDPSHLSEYERAKRMSSVFFDVGAWEQEVAKRKAQEDLDEAEGRRRKKKPGKADLVRGLFPWCCFRSLVRAGRVAGFGLFSEAAFDMRLTVYPSESMGFRCLKERYKAQKEARKKTKYAWLRE